MSPLHLLWILPLLLILPLFSRSVRRRLFARFYDRVTRRHEAFLRERKRSLLADVRGRVVEIGPGTGANFAYLPEDIEWIGLEPNPHMHRALRRRAEKHGIRAELRMGSAESMDLPDDSVACVISTLVLCSVSDVPRALAEIRRVLEPGGRFVFLEHVAAPEGSAQRRTQQRIRPIWQWLGDGCCPNRETGRHIREAGFCEVEIEAFPVPATIAPRFLSPHIVGQARN